MTTTTTETPTAPAELWMLWHPGDDELKSGPGWCKAIDNPRGGENFLVCLSEADAIAAAKHQAETFFIDCTPVRVK
jgi:hypothetical protein